MSRGTPQRTGAKRSDLDLLIRALNHPMRRRILRVLATENSSAKSLAERFGASGPDVSYHLNRVLAHECGAVRLVDTVQRRGGTEKVYALTEKRLWVPEFWDGLPPGAGDGLRQFSLQEFLAQTLAVIDQGDAAVLSWQAAEVDEIGWHEIVAAAKRFQRTVDRAIDRARAHRPGSEKASLIKVVAGICGCEAAPARAVDAWGQKLSGGHA